MVDPLGAEADDGLARLRARLQATERAAARLVEDVARRAPPAAQPSQQSAVQAKRDPTPGPPPASGYAVPDPGPETSMLEEIAALLRVLGAMLPEELAREFGELAREALLLVRALIDWLIARLDREGAAAVEVTDIPIA